MHLEALGIFCDVVRHQSFSRAAAANAMSQSAASQAVRQIEDRLGAQLIDRSQRPWQLTPEGKLFFQGCRDIIERYHELEDAVRRRQQPAGYTVRVASMTRCVVMGPRPVRASLYDTGSRCAPLTPGSISMSWSATIRVLKAHATSRSL